MRSKSFRWLSFSKKKCFWSEWKKYDRKGPKKKSFPPDEGEKDAWRKSFPSDGRKTSKKTCGEEEYIQVELIGLNHLVVDA